MNRPKKYLLTLLRAYLDGAAVELAEDEDYAGLMTLAKCHNLCPTVFCVIKNAVNPGVVPTEIYKKLENSFFDSIFVCAKQTAVYEKICSILSRGSIQYLPFKGIVLREYYPVPEARLMGDIDILISPRDKAKAQKLLIDNGLVLDMPGGDVQEYICDGVRIELHTKIVSDAIGSHDLGALFCDAAQHAEYDCNGRGKPEDNYHFAYLIGHIAHHFWFYGAGAKMILDLAVMLKKCDIDCQWVIDFLDRQGLGEFAKIILTVCYQWFGIGTDYKKDTLQTQEFLLAYGAFGNMNRNKAAVVQRKELEQGSGKPDSRLKLLLPPYEKMRRLPYIGFIDGRPYLLPVAWAYRLIYNLKNRRKFVIDTVSNMGTEITNIEAKKELDYFKKIGLL